MWSVWCSLYICHKNLWNIWNQIHAIISWTGLYVFPAESLDMVQCTVHASDSPLSWQSSVVWEQSCNFLCCALTAWRITQSVITFVCLLISCASFFYPQNFPTCMVFTSGYFQAPTRRVLLSRLNKRTSSSSSALQLFVSFGLLNYSSPWFPFLFLLFPIIYSYLPQIVSHVIIPS